MRLHVKPEKKKKKISAAKADGKKENHRLVSKTSTSPGKLHAPVGDRFTWEGLEASGVAGLGRNGSC